MLLLIIIKNTGGAGLAGEIENIFLALGLIRFYQMTISRILPSSCRFMPSCSQYTYEAIQKKGIFRGIVMGIRRIARCHPLNAGGYDPIP